MSNIVGDVAPRALREGPDRMPAEHFTAADFAAMRAHPSFRKAVERYAALNLARYHALSVIERWMLSDVGRASLSASALILDAAGQLTPTGLTASPPVVRGEVSRGRARLYLDRAIANGLIHPAAPGEPFQRHTPLVPAPRFRRVVADLVRVSVEAATLIAPDIGAALPRMEDGGFFRSTMAHGGRIMAQNTARFPLDRPVRLFQDRDGATRMLEDLIGRQPPERERLLETCAFSRSALARASHCSRMHVARLLRDGEALGFLSLDRGALTVSPELSDDAETYFAGVLVFVIASTRAALAEV